MSYVRIGEDSDVYLIGVTDSDRVNVIECCGCKLAADVRKPRTDGERAKLAGIAPLNGRRAEDFEWDWGPVQHFRAAPATIAHLDAHRAAGHKVPEYAYERVREDDWMA